MSRSFVGLTRCAHMLNPSALSLALTLAQYMCLETLRASSCCCIQRLASRCRWRLDLNSAQCISGLRSVLHELCFVYVLRLMLLLLLLLLLLLWFLLGSAAGAFREFIVRIYCASCALRSACTIRSIIIVSKSP